MNIIDSDVIVIGAGIAGASAAYFLAPQARVTVIEREPQPGMHATGRSAALFSECYGSAQVRALTRASRAFLRTPPDGFAEHALLTPRGALIFGSEHQAPRLHALHASVAPHGTRIELLDAHATREQVPVLRPQAASLGVFEPDAADIDVHAVHQGFLRGLRAHGGTLVLDTTAGDMHYDGGRWHVHAGGQLFRAPLLLNAAGAWVDQVAQCAGVAPLGVQPRRRSAFTFAPPADTRIDDWPFALDADETFYFKPESGLLLGSPANADATHPHDVQPEAYDIALGIHRIEEATTMQIARPQRSWAGLRSFVADGDLVAGFAAGAPGFFWVAAQGGYGIQTCAAMGEACAHLALQRALPAHLQDAGINAAMLAPRG